MNNQVKFTIEGKNIAFTQIDNKFFKNYESENGHLIQFKYKNEKAWLSAIEKLKTKNN
jgi:hypothetical protein